jgi:hypothetical protein
VHQSGTTLNRPGLRHALALLADQLDGVRVQIYRQGDQVGVHRWSWRAPSTGPDQPPPSLRFARVLRYRPDKPADQADTIDMVRAIHAGTHSGA